MIADLDDLLTALYVFADDFLPKRDHNWEIGAPERSLIAYDH